MTAVKKKKRSRRRMLVIIDVMLLLCVAACICLVKIVDKRADEARAAEAAEEARIAEESKAADEEKAAEKAAAEEAASKEIFGHIYSYKGSADDAEYSLAAYDSAAEAGAEILAVPFVVSQSGTMYVADDDYADDLTGYGGYFSGMTDGQIDNLETLSGGKVLKLSELFDKYGKDKKYIIELKYTSERNLSALTDLIEKYDCEDAVSVSCRYFSGLRSLENIYPDMKKIFLCSNSENWAEALALGYVDEISVSREMMDESLCRAAHDRGKKFGAGILSTEEDIKSAVDMGADSYFTDETALAERVERGSRGYADQ